MGAMTGTWPAYNRSLIIHYTETLHLSQELWRAGLLLQALGLSMLEQERTVSRGAEAEGRCEIPIPLITPHLPCSEDYFLFLEICISRIQIASQLASWKGHISHQQQLIEESRG